MKETPRSSADDAKGLEGVVGDPTPSDLQDQQVQEVEHVGLGTQGQWHGAAAGAAVGALVGAVIGLVIALVALRDATGAMVLLPLVGLAFGAVAGGVYEGGRNPEREGELRTTQNEPDPSTSVEGNPPPFPDR